MAAQMDHRWAAPTRQTRRRCGADAAHMRGRCASETSGWVAWRERGPVPGVVLRFERRFEPVEGVVWATTPPSGRRSVTTGSPRKPPSDTTNPTPVTPTTMAATVPPGRTPAQVRHARWVGCAGVRSRPALGSPLGGGEVVGIDDLAVARGEVDDKASLRGELGDDARGVAADPGSEHAPDALGRAHPVTWLEPRRVGSPRSALHGPAANLGPRSFSIKLTREPA